MAVNERSFVRILPESTGDRINFYHTWDIEYSNKTGGFNIGDTVVGSLSGTQAIIIKDTVDNDIATSGVLSTILLPGYESSINTPSETLGVLGSPQATVVTAYCVYVNTTTLVGKNNPTYGQSIDALGQAYVRFGEGAPQFDAFGKLQTSQARTLGEHIFEYDAHVDHFTDVIVETASLAHQPLHSGLLLTTDTGATDSIKRTSNRYYKYQAGKSHLIEITCAIGDVGGKTSVNRIWGYGDDNDGVFFTMEGTTLKAMIRSSVTGVLVTRKINQADWNEDNLSGSGDAANLSGISIDVSKDNIYWLDLQWLGAGRVRFGIIGLDGRRITCHQDENANANNLPYMRTGTLPVMCEQTNVGTPGSASQFRVWCMVIKTEGEYEPPLSYFSGNVTGVTVTTPNCISSFRAKQTFKTKDNRIIAYGEKIGIFSSAETILVEIVKNGTLGGTPTWTINPSSNSSIEMDSAATTVTDGTVITSMIMGGNDNSDMLLTHIFGPDGEGMGRKADITTSPDIYSIRVTRLTGTTTDVSMIANWNEAQ